MGHPKSTIQFGIPIPSADGYYRSKYPNGDWPGIAGSASGVGATVSVSSPVGLAVGAALAAAAGMTDTAAAPVGVGGGSASAAGIGITDTASAPGATASFGGQSGLQFPSNGTANSDVRLNWLGANLPPRTSQTVITKVRFQQQTGYYAVVWRCHNDGTFHYDKYELGTHPYPATGTVDGTGQSTGGTQSTGTTHYFEMAGLGDAPANLFGHDYLASPGNANGAPLLVVKGIDYIQISTVAVEGSNLVQRFWPDAVNNPTFRIEQSFPLSALSTSVIPVLLIGPSPWTSTNFAAAGAGATNVECPSCIVRGIKIFSQPLSFTDALAEAQSGMNTAVTPAGQAATWYMNENPTPTDITDKSGANHTPTWANANRPALYTAGSGAAGAGSTATAAAPTASASGGGGGGGGGGSLAHAQLATVTGSGFGTRPDYNSGNYTWQGFRHIHLGFLDFAAGFPAGGSSKPTFMSDAFCKGFFPSGGAALNGFVFNTNIVRDDGVTIENGGPSKSGKFFRKTSIVFAAFGYMELDTTNLTPAEDITIFKTRGNSSAKIYRQWRVDGLGDWFDATGGVQREEASWPYDSSAFNTAPDDPIIFHRHQIITSVVNGSRITVDNILQDFEGYIGGVSQGLVTNVPLAVAEDNGKSVYCTWPNSTDPGYRDIADIYKDHTAARVELWNAAGTVREIQLVTSWSDTSISFACNKGELSAGAVNIKVINASDQVIATISGTIA